MNPRSKIYVAGHHGMVGSAVVCALRNEGFENLLTRSSKELDLTRQQGVEDFFAAEKPEYVFMAAAKVGGIHANNTYRAEFIRINLAIQTNIIHAAWLNGVQKLLFFGSSCIYPKMCPQPMREDYLFSGPLEPTNSPYAVAKLSGVEMCRAYHDQYGCKFFTVLPTNLYGPNDNYHPQNSHVLPALIARIHQAKVDGLDKVVIWGTGTPRREFLYADDLAEASVYLMRNYESPDPVNIGTGEDLTIRELAQLIARVVGYQGELEFDPSKPDGTPRKLLDVSRLHALGWQAGTSLEQGIRMAYEDYVAGGGSTR